MSTAPTAIPSAQSADEVIRECIRGNRRSFFLYAGAGSGKTRSLVDALQWLQQNRKGLLWKNGRRVGVITYTNAATDEIKRRTAYDPFVGVSTIHSFAWDLVGTFTNDIKGWLKASLNENIEQLRREQAKGRAGSKAALTREYDIEAKSKRLASLESVRRFVYSPTGENKGRDALNHSEVINVTAQLLIDKPTLQQVLVDRFPILFVDESQDTNNRLMDALLAMEVQNTGKICLGLFGDTMQRIYTDGKVGLTSALPESWARPAKLVNYRCPTRILELINRIRSEEDEQKQVARPNAPEGFARCFIAAVEDVDKPAVEARVAERMAEITETPAWATSCKRLILEHHMAALRLGFLELFEPLYAVERYRTGLLDGSLPPLHFLISVLLPLAAAVQSNDKFRISGILRKESPLLDSKLLKAAGENTTSLVRAREAIEALGAALVGRADPELGTILRTVHESGLLEIPTVLGAAMRAYAAVNAEEDPEEQAGEETAEGLAWATVLATGLAQLKQYASYIADRTAFGTHQGVKGLEFRDVMVIIDDSGARGFLFSYDKLFGLKAKTDADLKNESAGKETTIDRTRRLLYVTCSRAENSLALVAYSSKPQQLARFMEERGWFQAHEIELLT